MNRILMLSLAASLLLAGCTDEAGDDAPADVTPTPTSPAGATPTPVASTPVATPVTNATHNGTGNETAPPAYVPYNLTVTGFPTAVEAGKNFTFRLTATGGVAASSDHIGAHYGNRSAPEAAANTTTYARACTHVTVATPVPGAYNVTCRVAEAGEWFFRGHVRVGANDSWGEELRLVVRPAWVGGGNYTLNATGVPSSARVGENVTFTLEMSGPTGLSSHFGAHYGNASGETPSTTLYASGCSHQGTPTTVPASYVVTCVFGAPGTYYLRGHLRLDEGLIPASRDYWTGEHAILVQ